MFLNILGNVVIKVITMGTKLIALRNKYKDPMLSFSDKCFCKIKIILQRIKDSILKISIETRKRIVSGIIFALFFTFLIVQGEKHYIILIFIVGIVMLTEWMSMIENIKRKNINFYYSYRKLGMGYAISTCISLILIREVSQRFKSYIMDLFCNLGI